MAIVLDSTTEQRIQRQIEQGAFSEPKEVLDRALDLLEGEDWLLRNKEAINADLDRTFAQADRGEGYTPEESRVLLAQYRASRTR